MSTIAPSIAAIVCCIIIAWAIQSALDSIDSTIRMILDWFAEYLIDEDEEDETK